MGSELFEAVRATDPRMPPALEAFDRIVASGDPRPDFVEHSMRAAHGLSPNRFTCYFDVHRRGAAVARAAGARFVELAAELGLAMPAHLSAFVQSHARGDDEVLQVVLGIDAPLDGSNLRGKYYLVFRGNPRACVRELLDALGSAAVGRADPGSVYIVGVDVTRAGVDDVKLYFRLERRRVPALLDNLSEVSDLLEGSRDIVFQQCTLHPERRQLYLHARSAAMLAEWLGRHGFGETLKRAGSINAHLRESRLDPWIVSFAYEHRRVDLRAGNVYFHLARR